MRIFYKEEDKKIQRSRELAERLKKINPQADQQAIAKIEAELLARHNEREVAVKLGKTDDAYRLMFEIERLRGQLSDTKLVPWKEKDTIIKELTQLTAAVVENSVMWLQKEITEADFLLEIEIVEKPWDPYKNIYNYRIKSNFKEVRQLQEALGETRKQIVNMAGKASIEEIEKLYRSTIEKIPSRIPCGNEETVDEMTYQEMRASIPSGPDKPSKWLTMTSYKRYIP